MCQKIEKIVHKLWRRSTGAHAIEMNVTDQPELEANSAGTASQLRSIMYFRFTLIVCVLLQPRRVGSNQLISTCTFCNKEVLEPSQEATVLRCFFTTHIMDSISDGRFAAAVSQYTFGANILYGLTASILPGAWFVPSPECQHNMDTPNPAFGTAWSSRSPVFQVSGHRTPLLPTDARQQPALNPGCRLS